MFPHYEGELPTIKRIRDGKGMPYHCDYRARISALEGLTKAINEKNLIQPTL